LRTEAEVQRQFPVIGQIASKTIEKTSANKYPPSSYELMKQARDSLGDEYFQPIRIMMNVRHEINWHIDAIRSRLHDLDEKIGVPE
jgi:uncharacterized protein with HEPN domain